jgi:hypothetical protein
LKIFGKIVDKTTYLFAFQRFETVENLFFRIKKASFSARFCQKRRSIVAKNGINT